MQHTEGNLGMLGATIILWILQAFTLSEWASVATIMAGTATAAFHIYNLYRKVQQDKEDDSE